MKQFQDLHRLFLTRGFTLIELLVVVLIIGILAAVAVPQYRKAVEKSHMVQALSYVDAMQKGMELYMLEGSRADHTITMSFEHFWVGFNPILSAAIPNGISCNQGVSYGYCIENFIMGPIQVSPSSVNFAFYRANVDLSKPNESRPKLYQIRLSRDATGKWTKQYTQYKNSFDFKKDFQAMGYQTN